MLSTKARLTAGEARKQFWDIVTLEGFGITLAIVAVVIAVFGYFTVNAELTWLNVLTDFYANVSSELVSIVITVLVLDAMNKKRQDDEEKIRLMSMLRSNENVVVESALAGLKACDWDRDGTLRGVNLRGVRLEGANLRFADLRGANLRGARLKGANLGLARLEGADLRDADLRDADLRLAGLRGADLKFAKLQDANLFRSTLEDADLAGARLEGTNLGLARLRGANLGIAERQGIAVEFVERLGSVKCDEMTILPDFTHWTEDVNWRDFDAFDSTEAYKAASEGQ